MKSILLATQFLIFTFCLSSEAILATNSNDIDYTRKDKRIFQKIVNQFSEDKQKPINELIIDIALYFQDTPYVAGTLEHNEEEKLVINLQETDCILFVEMCYALAHTIKTEQPSFEYYCNFVRNTRYINGKIDGYPSRHHYTSGWIQQNIEKGLVEELSSEMGRPLDQEFSYMSSNPQSYKQLTGNVGNQRKIIEVEDGLNKYDYHFLNKEDLANNTSKIKNGDIICFVSVVEGLDISHVAYAYWVQDTLHFIHASSVAKKVVIEEKSLYDYTRYGLRIVRPIKSSDN